MKDKTNLQEVPLETLQKQEKALKIITGMLAGLLLVLFSYSAYSMITGGKSTPLFVVPLALLPIVFVNVNNIRKIGAEIESRS